MFQYNINCLEIIFADPMDSEIMGQPHAMIEKKEGLI